MWHTHTYGYVMSRHNNKSWHRIAWIMAHVWMSRVQCMDESCHTNGWVTSHVWMSRATDMNESCHTYEWVRSHANESCNTYEYSNSLSTTEPSCTLVAAAAIPAIKLYSIHHDTHTYTHMDVHTNKHIWASSTLSAIRSYLAFITTHTRTNIKVHINMTIYKSSSLVAAAASLAIKSYSSCILIHTHTHVHTSTNKYAYIRSLKKYAYIRRLHFGDCGLQLPPSSPICHSSWHARTCTHMDVHTNRMYIQIGLYIHPELEWPPPQLPSSSPICHSSWHAICHAHLSCITHIVVLFIIRRDIPYFMHHSITHASLDYLCIISLNNSCSDQVPMHHVTQSLMHHWITHASPMHHSGYVTHASLMYHFRCHIHHDMPSITHKVMGLDYWHSIVTRYIMTRYTSHMTHLCHTWLIYHFPIFFTSCRGTHTCLFSFLSNRWKLVTSTNVPWHTFIMTCLWSCSTSCSTCY